MTPTLEVSNLCKTFSASRSDKNGFALNGVSCNVASGEIVGLLGLNGAGKSTFMKVVLDLMRPTAGGVRLFGYPNSSNRWRSKVGYLPEAFDAPKESTARNVLLYLGRIGGLFGNELHKRVAEVFETMDLVSAANKKVKEFSKGMKLRLGFAQALLNKPSLLMLDEPTDGLDPRGILLIRRLLPQLRDEGVSVLMNSHMLSEIELVADRIMILHKGQMVKEGKTAEMLPQGSKYIVEIGSNPPTDISGRFQQKGASWFCELGNIVELEQNLKQLDVAHIDVVAIHPLRPTLEQVFFQSIDPL